MKIEQVFVDGVDVGERLRPLNEATVQSLVESMGRLGLLQPITVYTPDNNRIILVAGYHRLEAARRLEWDEIDCIFVNADEIECQLREIAENLHRAELTALERDEHIAKWVELAAIKARQVDEPLKGGRQPNEKGQAKAARELGISEPDARRAAKVASLSDEAKQVARDTGLDDNRSVLLAATKQSDDVTYLRAEHARREAERQRKEVEKLNGNTDRVIALSAAEEFAQWIMARTDLNELPTIISWLEGTKPRDVIAAMRRAAA